jgi:hypothetical protein
VVRTPFTKITFSTGPFWFLRVLLVVVLVPMVLIGIAFLVDAVYRPGWGSLFGLAWGGIAAWNAYWFLFRIALRLTATPEYLEWQGVIRHGRIPINELRRLRPSVVGSNLEVIECADGTSVIVWVRRGFRAFCDALKELRPELEVRLGWQARAAEAWPTWWPMSGFRRT